MALNAAELKGIGSLIRSLGKKPRVLMLGYPDLLLTPDSVKAVDLALDWNGLAKRTDDTVAVWTAHGRGHLAALPMLETKSVFSALGAEAIITDAIPWGGQDSILDLNKRISRIALWRLGKFDLIIDPGTLEHCFNIAQAFENVDRLLKRGGMVYHQAAAAFPNHGFWSISPTAFFDFYQGRGYELGKAHYWQGSRDQEGFIPGLIEADPFAPVTGDVVLPLICSYVFRKTLGLFAARGRYPTQRCYSNLSREIKTVDFLREHGG